MTVEIKRYDKTCEKDWNLFVERSKNPLFMFNRNYMDYHSDRFKDHSLMFFEEGKLVALLPANEKDKTLYSHGGLTYGGLILNDKAKQHTVNDCFDSLMDYANAEQLLRIVYKAIPHIYHEQPCEEDIYALYRCGAVLKEVTASTVINLKNPLKMPKGRKAQISRAKREGVEIFRLLDKSLFDKFIDVENDILESRHHVRAVHTSDELFLLYNRFPQNISLYGAIYKNELIAGTVVYEYNQLVHTQYMAATEIARQIGALDLTIATVIENYSSSKQWLDFGISTEDGGRYLNEGLISQKESFGGRTNVYTLWEVVI